MTAARITVRRAETRARLLAAAFAVFAEEGFGRASVEQVCDRAGFTRGAFYSNFSSLDELFLAMWEERSANLLADLRAALEGIDSADADEMIRRVLRAIPVDDAWFRVSLEFTAHALRNPALREAMAAREEAIQRTVVPIVATALARAGRRVRDRTALGHALVAIHDGTAAQVLLRPGSRAVRRRREQLFRAVLESYSEEIP
ncbi:MAG: TetR/AcrR family transcriptional regulator [Jatrophihabitans sp.]|nr:MAG: TetR/AcrR family transcriptional regulator [Jatrophihabitans sp.]